MAQEKGLLESLLEKDPRGTPQNEHFKKLAKQRSEKLKEVVTKKTFYTTSEDGKKILFMTVKACGVYSSYIGKAAKMQDYLTRKKKDGTFVHSGDADALGVKWMNELQKEGKG